MRSLTATVSPWLDRDWGQWVYTCLRWGLGLVFVYAGAVKLADPAGFARLIASYHMAPPFLVAPLALGLPALEVLAGLGLILEVPGCLSVIFGLLVMFSVVLWWGVLQGLEIDCGCFSASELAEHDSLRQAFRRDLAMMAAALFLYWWRWRRGAVRRAWRYTFPSSDWRDDAGH